MAHSQFAPSKAHRWLECVASIAEERAYPNTSSGYADEGSAAHVLGQRALDHKKDAIFFLGEGIQPRVGSAVYTVDEDMAKFVQVYLDYVRGVAGADGMLLVEENAVYATVEGNDQAGTTDCAILSASGEELTIVDLKFGQGVKVYAKDNPQMKAYALGLLKKYAAIFDAVKRVKLVVVQPRIDHIDEWPRDEETALTPAELFDFGRAAEERMKEGLHAIALQDSGQPIPDEYYQPSEKACRFCPHKANCDAIRRQVAKEVFDDMTALDSQANLLVHPDPKPPPSARLGALWGPGLDLIEGWVRACRAEGVRLVTAGIQVIGPDGLPLKLAQGKQGNMAWTDEAAAAALAEGLLARDKVYEPEKIRTPAKIRDALGKKRKEEWTTALEPLTRRAPGALKVVLGSDPAPAYTGAASADEFPDQPVNPLE